MCNSYKIKYIFYVLVFILTNLVYAQSNIYTETITIKDGLSSNSIRDIIQDQYGYMWIATGDGINIYDGYNITVIKNDPEDSTSLPSNNIFRLLEDRDGTIWISTLDGLVKYDRNKNSFKTFRHSNSVSVQANWVLDIYEDSRNNLWIATGDGNLQFDRKTEEYKRFDVMLTDNSVLKYVNFGGIVREADDGGLYNMAESYGLLKFDYNAQLFVQVPLKDNFNEKISPTRYLDMVVDAENNIWFGNFKGLYKIDLNENKAYDLTPFQKKNPTISIWDNAVVGLLFDKNQNIWVGTGRNGLYLLDTKDNNFERLISSSSINTIQGLFVDNSGLIWFGSTRGVSKYDFNRKPFETYNISDEVQGNSSKAVFSIANSDLFNNKVWLGTAQGVYLFNGRDNTVAKASVEIEGLSQWNGIEVSGILESDKENLWIGTRTEGLYSYDLQTGNKNNYRYKVYDNRTLFSDNIRAISKDKHGNLWVGTRRGLNVLKKGSNEIVRFPSFSNRKYEHSLIEKVKELRVNSIPTSSLSNVGDYADLSKEFVLRNDSKVLIYSVGEGSPAWNMVDYGWLESNEQDTLWSGNQYSESFYLSGSQKNRIKISLLELKKGRYKLRYKSDDTHSAESYNEIPPQDSSSWGTQIFTLSDNEFNLLSESLKNSIENTYLENNNIRIIFEDSKNNIWVGTNYGISKIDSNLTIQNYYNSPTEPNSLSNNFVRDINEDTNGNIWIATTNGLNKLDVSTNTFTVLREKDGLPTTNVKAIEVDDEGDLWVSGLKGISKIELDENGNKQIIVNFDVKDGLQGYEFLNNSSLKDESGKLYFAGLDGFNAFYSGSSNRTPPFLSFQDIRISNKSVTASNDFESSDLNQISELSLSHNQNDLSFEFASIHFSRPDKNRLMYKMEGVDDEWQVGDRRFASYANMSPGDYTFYIKGSNGDGIWSEETKQINIYISPPWYNNWIAYAAYVAIFFGILYSVRKFEIRRQQKNSKIKESQLRAEAAELQAKVAETQSRAIQAENDRQSKELEEARELQLSMLPKDLPNLPNLDIAVYMQTATEVGGDYYDFHVGMDGTLTVVVGDATGHGMKAGTMVTTTKSLFNVLAPNPNIVETFQEMTRCLKLMQMNKLSMCMTMLKIEENKLRMSTAGMPPIFIYKSESQSIEEHLIKGMPLGTFNDFPYSLVESSINSGDTILVMSDGFPELINNKKEMFGYKRTRNLFEELATESPEEIITKLKDAGSDWVNNQDPDDDVTFVVIKVK